MARCKVWVQSSTYDTTIRADQIIALRVTADPRAEDPRAGDPDTTFHLEAVTADPAGQALGPAVRLCSGQMEDFAADATRKLTQLIARHIDNRVGGIIDCADEKIADELPEGMFCFTPFRNTPPGQTPASQNPGGVAL